MNLAFKPLAGHNAIETCSVTIRFFQPLDEAAFTAVKVRAAEVARDNNLPGQQQIMFPQIIFGAAPSAMMTAGAVYQRYAPNGQLQAELRCEPQALTVQLKNYSSWVEFKDTLLRAALQLVPLYLVGIPAVTNVNLQYDDVFVSETISGSELPQTHEVFRTNTPWLPAPVTAAAEQWHSHNGVFFPIDDDRRELINVNATANDVIDIEGAWQRRVSLAIVVGMSQDIPKRQPWILEISTAEQSILDVLEKSHQRQKVMLNEILADQYLELIGAKL